ncbi:MAG: hypothetical protein IJ776_10815 [Paludibacteraceae bacterium]|nr:hypothetical protein [Paludibacteraceae bacterium]
MNTASFPKLVLSLILTCCLFACNNPNEEPKQPEQSFEDRLCHKWECWQLQTGTAVNPIDSATTYVTFLRDGKLLFESDNLDEVGIYQWEKVSESEIIARFPVPTDNLEEFADVLSMLGINEDSFVDTVSVNAIVKELTDTTLILLGNIEISTILTKSAIDRLSKSELTKGLLTFRTQYQLYMRKEE